MRRDTRNKNSVNAKFAVALLLWPILLRCSYLSLAQNTIPETVVMHFSPCQLVMFSKRMNGCRPELAVQILSQAAMLEVPLESLENSQLFRKANYKFKHRKTCVVYLSFHPTPREMTADKVDLLLPFFDMVANSLSLPENE